MARWRSSKHVYENWYLLTTSPQLTTGQQITCSNQVRCALSRYGTYSLLVHMTTYGQKKIFSKSPTATSPHHTVPHVGTCTLSIMANTGQNTRVTRTTRKTQGLCQSVRDSLVWTRAGIAQPNHVPSMFPPSRMLDITVEYVTKTRDLKSA